MRLIHKSRALMILLMVLWSGSLSQGEEKDKKTSDKAPPQGTVHTVEAGVGYATGSGVAVQAEKQPGEFTIAQGSKGAKLKYDFADPKADYTSTKLRGSNIYSITEKRYMRELDKDPNFVLPPGDYRFIVGGLPGATGVLTYTSLPGDSKPPILPPDAGGPPGADDPRKLNGTRHTIEARVIYPNRPLDPSIQAELQPGPFTIPEGYKAVDLKFNWYDPKTGLTSENLRPSHIKCLNSRRPPKKEDFQPGLELHAGEYLFIVGGLAGATGVLNYTLTPDNSPVPEDKNPDNQVLHGSPILHHGIWLPEKYFPPGYRLYPGEAMPAGDPPTTNSSQSLWYGIPLQSEGGNASSSAGEHPYTVFIDGVTVFKSTALAKKFFQMWKEGPPTETEVALGEEAFVDDDCRDSGSLFKEYSGKDGIFRRDLNVRNIRVGRVTFGVRVNGDQVTDFNPEASNSRRFVAHETPSREDLLRLAETFVDRVREFARDKGWLED